MYIALFSCKWDGNEDECAKIEAITTDAGHCFTFNRDEQRILTTKETGSYIK
jgi:hypothetical protein